MPIVKGDNVATSCVSEVWVAVKEAGQGKLNGL